MSDKFELLEEKIGKVVQVVDLLRSENVSLQQENSSLQKQLTRLGQELHQLKLTQNDQADAVKTKLSTLLNRIEELENIE